jgi:3',5'-cyclic AMP phosphodiesterase CpdA
MVADRGVQRRMKIRVLSDLHLEFQDWIPPKSDADIIVLAGDIHVGVHGVGWARRTFPLRPVVYVPGNHEFYGAHMGDLTEELRAQGRRLGVDVLDGQSVVIGGCEVSWSNPMDGFRS